MRRIPDLKDKIDFVESVSEFHALRARYRKAPGKPGDGSGFQGYLRQQLQKKSYARELGVQEAQWTRIKKGDNPVKDHQLSTLASYLDLVELGGADLWSLPLEEFKDVLRRKGYGKLAASGDSADLPARLRAIADLVPSIRIVGLDETATRGIGDPDDTVAMPVLKLGQRARIEVAGFPFDGHAIVLSEDPSRRLVLLGAADGFVCKVVKDGKLILPSPRGSYPVGKPVGRHSLYAAIFDKAPIMPEMPTTNEETTGPLSFPGTTALSAALAGAGEGLRVGLLDYRVE